MREKNPPLIRLLEIQLFNTLNALLIPTMRRQAFRVQSIP